MNAQTPSPTPRSTGIELADTAQPPPSPHADVPMHGGRIMTMDDANTVVDAVLIRSGRVVATGEAACCATDVAASGPVGRGVSRANCEVNAEQIVD